MSVDSSGVKAGDDIPRRNVPCLITYINPFRIVAAESLPPWNASIEDVNRRSWDYAGLHEIVGGIDVGLESPYHMLITRDGALALPPVPELRNDQKALEFFNRCLAAMLLGGVYCEAITSDGLDIGNVIDWKFVRSQRYGLAAPNRFHEHIRLLQASPLEAIQLYQSRTEKYETIREATANGLGVMTKLPMLRGEYLLRGTTGIARRDWGGALANLWIVIEQIISTLWLGEVVTPTLAKDSSKARKNQLLDTRTWTAAARLELLNQTRVISDSTLNTIGVARKARNELSHEGKAPTERDATAAYEGMCDLLRLALGGSRPKMFDLKLSDHSLSDPFASREDRKIEPTHWMKIPKLPGEIEIEREEAAARNRKHSDPG